MAPEQRMDIKAGCREIVHGRSTNTFVTLTQPLEHKNGYVFLLLDIGPECRQAPRVISLLRESVERLGRGVGESGHLQHRFEQLLQAVNQELSHMVGDDCPIESMHMALGVLRNDAFILSALGKVELLFLRRTNKQRFRVFDLSQSIITETGKTDPEKPFHVVLDGDLQPDDVLLVASRNLKKDLDVERIHPLLTTLPPGSALETIEQYAPAHTALALILFQARKDKVVLTGYGEHASSKTSMEAMLSRERDTSAVLELEKPHVQQLLMRAVHLLRTKDPIERKEALRRAGDRVWRVVKAAAVRVVQLIGTVIVSSGSLVAALFTRGSKRDQALKSVRQSWQKFGRALMEPFVRARARHRFLVAGSVALVVIIAVSIGFLQVQRKTARADAAFESQLTTAREERDAATASQVYQDEPSARTHIAQALAALDIATPRTEEQTKERDALRATLENSLRDLRHIVEPSLTSLAIVNNVAVLNSHTLVLLRDGSLVTIESGALTPRTIDSPLPTNKSATRHTTSHLFLGADALLRELPDGASAVRTVDINAVDQELASTIDMLHYGDRLYVLTPTQLYRHQRVENGGYGPGVAWLSDAMDLASVTALAIDGTVWVADGRRVRHFDRGQEAGADLRTIDPPLGIIKDLWTVTETSLLFILDPENERVVVYNKADQKMVAQYVHGSLRDAIGITVDLTAKTATVIAPTTVHTFPLTNVMP